MKINTNPNPCVICFIDTADDHFVGKVEGEVLFLGNQIQARIEPMFKLRQPLDKSVRPPPANMITNVYHQCILSAREWNEVQTKSDSAAQRFNVSNGNLGGTTFDGTVSFSNLKSDLKKMESLERQAVPPLRK